MVDISVNTNGSISLSANNSSNINANTNGEAQRAKSWAVGTGLIDGVDYSSKYYALLAKQSEEIATEAVETIGTSVEAAQGYAEDAASSAEYIVNHAPTITVEQTETGATITATDMQGTTTADVINGIDGQDGQNGQDGFSPIATVTKSGTVTTITITDKNGTTTERVLDGTGSITDVKANNVSVVTDGVANITIPTDTGDLTNGAGFITSAALSGYATQTWVGQQGYLTAITSSDVTTALGYVPVSETTLNDYLRYRADLTLSNITSMGNLITSEFDQVYDELATKISGITSSDVTNALGYTPYNSTNPNGYISGITSTDVTNALGYTPVNKSGDTMTGPLNNMNTSVTKGTNPSSNKYWEWRNLDNNQNPAEWHTNRMSAFQTTLYPNGTVETQIKAFQNDPTVSTTADIKLAITSSGVKSCEFPNTTCCDGQWVNNSGQLANSVSLPVGNDQRLEYDISNYLPNDNYRYEVRFSIDAQTGSGSGAGLSISLTGKAYNNVDTWVRVCNMYARGSWIMVVGNSAIVPIGTDRKVKLNYTVISKAAQLNGLHIEAYRRIGSNL